MSPVFQYYYILKLFLEAFDGTLATNNLLTLATYNLVTYKLCILSYVRPFAGADGPAKTNIHINHILEPIFTFKDYY